MLSLNFEIHQDGKDAENQARGVVAALVAIYGPSVLPTGLQRYTAPAAQVLVQSTHIPEWATPAPDGYPTKPIDAEPVNSHEDAGGSEPPARDSAGIPWDERIHASTKTTTANGQWTRRRNTPDKVFDDVMAELKAANTAMTLAAATSGGLIDKVGTLEMGIPEPSAAEAFATPVATVPAPPVTPSAPTVPTPPPAAVGDAPPFLTIMQLVTAKQRDGKLDQAKLAELLAAVELTGVPQLVSAPADARANFYALVSAV